VLSHGCGMGFLLSRRFPNCWLMGRAQGVTDIRTAAVARPRSHCKRSLGWLWGSLWPMALARSEVGEESCRQKSNPAVERHRSSTNLFGRSALPCNGLGESGTTFESREPTPMAGRQRSINQLQLSKAGQELGTELARRRGARIYWSWPQRLWAWQACIGALKSGLAQARSSSEPAPPGQEKARQAEPSAPTRPDATGAVDRQRRTICFGRPGNAPPPSGPANSDALAAGTGWIPAGATAAA